MIPSPEYCGYVLSFMRRANVLPPYRREWLGECWLLTLPNPAALRGWKDARREDANVS
jgi:hypothetical protein